MGALSADHEVASRAGEVSDLPDKLVIQPSLRRVE